MSLREAAFALRVVRRRGGQAAIVYRRMLDDCQRERLLRVAAISPLAFTAGAGLLRAAVGASRPPSSAAASRTVGNAGDANAPKAGRSEAAEGKGPVLAPGPFYPLDPDWGARVACYALVAAGLRDGERLHRAAEHLRYADGVEAAWWYGLMANGRGGRARRALRILLEAVP